MPTNCEGVFQNQVVDCLDPLVPGVVQRLFMANLNDIASVTRSVVPGEENVITAIIMKATKTFFEIDGVNQSITAQTDIVPRAGGLPGYKHTVGANIFEVDNVSLQNIQAMAFQPTVCIVLGNDDSSLGNGPFSYLGGEVGLDVITNTRIYGDVESSGSYVLSLETPAEGRSEQTLPSVIWSTDYATTLALVEALLTNP